MVNPIPLFAFVCLVAATGTLRAADADGFHELLKRKLVAEPLEWSAIRNEHLVAGEINGKAVTFHIDSGAARSILALRSVETLGLKVSDTGQTQPAIGGRQKMFSTIVDTLRVGRSIRAGRQHMLVLDMPRTIAPDGLIGGDILAAIGAVIDHRDHLLLVRRNGDETLDLAAEAEKRAMASVRLDREGNYHFLTLRSGDEELRFILDTGSQQSLLDSKTAERLRLPMIDTDVRAAGVGVNTRKTRLTTIDRLTLGEVTLRRTPMLVLPVGEFGRTSNRPVHGILGAEFLFASGAVFDAGSRRLYLPPGELDVRPFAKTGSEILGNDEELAHHYQSAGWVGGVNILRFTLESAESREQSPTQGHTAARIDLEITDTIKGGDRFASGAPLTLTILLPNRPNMREWASGVLGRNPRKLLFLPAEASLLQALPWERTLFTDGELPRAQIQRIRQPSAPP